VFYSSDELTGMVAGFPAVLGYALEQTDNDLMLVCIGLSGVIAKILVQALRSGAIVCRMTELLLLPTASSTSRSQDGGCEGCRGICVQPRAKFDRFGVPVVRRLMQLALEDKRFPPELYGCPRVCE
jgi:hypothetical protein